MKKIMAVLTVLMCFASANAFAQLKEVRGVQTRMVEYQSDQRYGGFGYSRHGFEFKNENSYPVWVDMELFANGFYDSRGREIKAGTCFATKSITLNPEETYVWKCGDQMLEAAASIDIESRHKQFYVKYKAYKAE